MSLKDYCFDGSQKLSLKNIPCDSKKDNVKKEEILAKTAKNQLEIEELQDKLYAAGKEGLVIVLQAMDAAGKDGTVKHVMSGINPQGIDVHSFKQPSSEEMSHDFLWRVNKVLPSRGKIGLFNRSYYEDVLVVKVHNLQHKYNMAERCLKDKSFFKKRYKHIANYEEYLYDSSYRVIKIFLNISKDEQKKRFMERINRPEKNWKFSANDLSERALWDNYQEAYEEAINATATKNAPWYVLPADQKWYTRYLVSEAILKTLRSMNPQYPTLPAEQEAMLQKSKETLENEK